MSCRQEDDFPKVEKVVVLAELLDVLQSLEVEDLLYVQAELLANLCSDEEESISD